MSPKANIVLSAGRFHPPITIEDPEGPVSHGAAGGAASAIQTCASGSVLSIVCLPIAATVGAVRASAADAKVAASSKERIENSERVAVTVEPVNLNQLLLERVKKYARDSGVGELADLPGQGPMSPHDKRRYHGEQDYVLEIALTERTVTMVALPKVAGYPTSYFVGFSIQGRLIRMADNAVVRVFSETEVTELKCADEWSTENGKLVMAELDNALQRIAKTFVDRWIRPAISGVHDAHATVVIFRPHDPYGSARTAVISIDGCIVGSLDNRSFLTLRTSAGKHIMRSEGIGKASFTMELEPAKTHYVVFHLYPEVGGRGGFAETSEDHAKRNIPIYQGN